MKLNKKDKNSVAKALALYTQMGVTMAACIIVSFFIGRLLDGWLGTSPIFLLIFMLIGLIASIRSMYIMVKNQFKD